MMLLSLLNESYMSLSPSILPHSSPHLCYMGFSSDDHVDTEHIQLQFIDESLEGEENLNSGGMDLHHHQQQQQQQPSQHGVEVEFWPLEHPMEPLDEDQPIKCPMEESSVTYDGVGMHKEQPGESSWRRRTHHHSAAARGGGRGRMVVAEAPPRAVRKRHHTLTRGTGDHILTPFMRMPTLPLQPHNITIFQMLQQLDKFEPS